MFKHVKLKISTGTRIALLAGIACIGCCTLPWIGVAIGSAAMARLAGYSDLVVCSVALAGFVTFIVWRVVRRDGPSCDINGNCKPYKSDE